jgi:hypothetical protein
MATRTIPIGYASDSDARASTVIAALRLLVPWDLEGQRKVLLGAPGDGSYVLVDRCRPSQAVLSFGIGPTVSFDLAMAERGHRIFMFDHTIDAVPAQHERFTWIRTGLASVSGQSPELATLEEHLARLDLGPDDPILKIDIEGDEWDVFAGLPAAVLRRFEQITFEAHSLSELEKPEFSARVQTALRNLSAHFTLCHVHANNFGTIAVLADSLPVPEAMELTYIRSDLTRAVRSTTFYPTPYDAPNFPQLPELKLWFYPFMPGSAEMRP